MARFGVSEKVMKICRIVLYGVNVFFIVSFAYSVQLSFERDVMPSEYSSY